MPFFSFLHDSSGIGDVFAHDRARYRPICDFAQNIMRGPSPLSAQERELIAAYVSTLNQCRFCAGSHMAIAADLGVDVSILEDLLGGIDGAGIPARLKPIFRFVKKLTEQPARMIQADADAVYAAGWDETALGDTIAVCAFFNMANRLADGYGLKALPPERLADLAKRLNQVGYLRPLLENSGV